VSFHATLSTGPDWFSKAGQMKFKFPGTSHQSSILALGEMKIEDPRSQSQRSSTLHCYPLNQQTKPPQPCLMMKISPPLSLTTVPECAKVSRLPCFAHECGVMRRLLSNAVGLHHVVDNVQERVWTVQALAFQSLH
jgi:hypothetical protein